MTNSVTFARLLLAVVTASSLSTSQSIAQNQNGAAAGGDSAAAKPAGSRRFRSEPRRASELMGYTVKNENAEELGSVKDLVIDTRSGRVGFVIVSTGGFAGIGAKLKAVPTTALSPATMLENTLALDITADRWEKAPSFTKGQLASLGYPRQARKLNQYYGQPTTEPPQTTDKPSSLTPTGRTAKKAGGLYLASDLTGRKVVNEQDQSVGEITDLLVDLKKPDVSFALLEPGSFITSGNESAKGGLFAIPMTAFIPGPKDKKFISDLTPGDFQQAGPLNADSWATATPGGSSPRIFRCRTNEQGQAAVTGQ